ncbi:MAG: EamA family transporter [Candidatus Omnitrophota bacterium]
MPQSGFQVLNIGDALLFAKISVLSPFLWLGLLSVLLTFVIWSTILSKVDLSVAVPVASFSYVFIPLVSMIFLRETIGPLRWAGIMFILIGVVCVSLSSKEKEVSAQ